VSNPRHRELREKALKGGTRYLPKLREQHKLTARERLDLLLDAGSFIEDGLYANVLADELPADGVVTGLGTIEGRQVAVMANSLGGLDCLVFTGGIGEHSSAVRQQICDRLQWLGVSLDASANDRADQCISRTDSKVNVLVIATSEETAIARHCAERLAELQSPA